ncbi:MAG TPA: ABC transporter substrate-binding protein [bacterium]|nr:ABC transporter substrate-binding protein [bacterium]
MARLRVGTQVAKAGRRAVLALGLTLALLAQAGRAQAVTLRVALNQDPDILDPSLARSYVGRIIFANMCEKLYDVDAQGNLIPQLAAGMPAVSNGGKTLEIRLRPGLLFNDGTPVTAEALKLSLERHKDIKGSARKSELSLMSSVEVVNPLTVRMQLSKPFAPLVATLADRAGMILAPAAVKELGERFGTHPVCVGPWMFTERVPQARIVLDKSPYYYDKTTPRVDRIEFRIIPDDAVRLANLRSGDIDMMHRVPPTEIKHLKDDASLGLSEVVGPGYVGLTINIANKEGRTKPPVTLDTPLAKSVLVRRALDLSIDRTVLNQVVFDGLFVAGCTPLAPNSPFYPKDIQCPTRDVAKAKALLAQAGFANGVKAELTVTNDPINNQVGQVIQGMAKDAGFDLTLRPVEFASMLDGLDAGRFQIDLLGWSGRPDPDGNIEVFQACHGSLNYSNTCNPDITALIDKAREASDFKARYALYDEAIHKMLEQESIIYLYHEQYIVAFSSKVQGYVATPDGLIRLLGVQVQ